MKDLKNILEKDLGRKWNLTREESSLMWESISRSLPSAAPIRRGGFTYWAAGVAAMAAAVVAGFFLLKSPSSEPAPFQPGTTPIEKTTNLADGSGDEKAKDNEAEKKVYQMPVLADAGVAAPDGQQGVSVNIRQGVSVNIQQNVPVNIQQDESVNIGEQESELEKTAPAGRKTVPSDLERGRKYADGYRHSSAGKRLAFSASSNVSGRSNADGFSATFIRSVASETGYILYSSAPVVEQISNTKYSLPLNFTLGVTYKINNVLSVGTGISYTYLHSKYNGFINQKAYEVKQGAHYIGVPLNLYINLGGKGALDFYAATGGAVEKGVKVSYQMKAFNGSTRSSDSRIKGLQFSVRAAAGVEYKFGKSRNVGIYIEPGASYYFDSNLPASLREDQPLQFEAQAGIRFHLK